MYDSLFNERVFVLKLAPEMNPSIFDLLKRDYDAVILRTFGIGGHPRLRRLSPRHLRMDSGARWS